MELIGKQHIPTSKRTVWKALNDLDVLKACIPGCEKIYWVNKTEIDLIVIIKLGFLKTSIEGTIYLSNIVENQSYTMEGKGKGKFAGLANGRADVKLTDSPPSTGMDTGTGSGTELSYKVSADVKGKLAKIGSKIVSVSAQKLSDKFFEIFSKEVIKAYGRE